MKKIIFEHYTLYADGTIYRDEKKVPQYLNGNGYLYVNIDGRFHPVHRLVASAFVPCYGGRIVNHKDGNRRNNHMDNLEWCTHKDNVRNAIERGTHFDLQAWKRSQPAIKRI